ncbi:STAS domain-containing protein [Methylosinus sp. H3A]|uniref:STAS domain-containing protein n=1 Tax=Methylosinus sp. H3A TaxID=2785786 RepID=UPI0018C32F3E|nr:STAS domain-containing protein [Methylosinus sp. H3A]MBG0808627.1 STAS domain-containing protein [Methylosinus sp. H3A]
MVTVRLPDILDIRAALPLATELLHARGNPLTIDASNVAKVGTQCIQVLLSAHATWTTDGLSLNVVHPSDTLLEALDTLGIPFTEISEQESAK